jgi:glutamate--cysteine ligase
MMSVSYDPLTNLEKVPKTPKQRYEIMTEEMPKNGKLSLHMMYQTCGTQINLDYTSEKDFIKKFKLSSFLVPLSIGIFANSPIKENKLSGYLSYRSKVWQNTSRAGLPKIFLENLDFEKYTDMAINMPLLFVLNNSNYLKGEGKTFKDFMEGKLETLNNRKPNIKDFDNHLTTIFTEIRLKRFIEIRSLDTCEWDCHCSGPAFYTGLLYGSLNEAFDIINKWNVIEVLNAYKDVPKKGLNTIINNKTLLEWGKIFLELARDGLEKRSIKNNTGKDESIFLRNIENILNNNKTRAFVTIEKFKNNNNLEFLYEKN